MVFSPLSSEERKDSLSVNVAFVKFHLSRSRRLTYEQEKQGNACVRFCTIINIGSASFKYDMRRLTEILIFPRAWYRRNLVRRLFLGKLFCAPPARSTWFCASKFLRSNNFMRSTYFCTPFKLLLLILRSTFALFLKLCSFWFGFNMLFHSSSNDAPPTLSVYW